MKTKGLLLIILSFFILSISLQGQSNKKKGFLSGYVTDNKGNPVSGAMILIDKKNSNIVTDSKGFYKVKVKPDASTISVFTFSGLNGESTIDKKTEVNIVLVSAPSGQADLKKESDPDKSVNVGYGSVEKKDLTNPVTKVKSTENKYSTYSNIYDMLKGTVPGLQVIGKTISVQSQSTTNVNSEPLMVVDGVIVSSVDNIHPSEVKSVEVLKGAAASIYGSRGANGVLLIKLTGGPGDK